MKHNAAAGGAGPDLVGPQLHPMPSRRDPSRPRQLRASDLRWSCPAAWIPAARRADRDDEGAVLAGLTGQERAVEALEMGLAVDAPGYNVFVAGIHGEEKLDAVRGILARVERPCGGLRDHVFVHNFGDPLRPHHLALPPGQGPRLRELMRDWLRTLRTEVPRLLFDEDHRERRRRMAQRYREAQRRLFRRVGRRARAEGLALVEVEDEEGSRHDIWISIDGKGVPPDELHEVPSRNRPSVAQLRRRMRARARLLDELERSRRQARRLAQRLHRELQILDVNRARHVVEDLMDEFRAEFDGLEKLLNWFDDAELFALGNLELFRRGAGGVPEPDETEDSDDERDDNRLPGIEVFEVNVVRSLSGGSCPTVYELHPNYSNLFGTVERRILAEGPGHYHLAVRPGSLLDAEGGFLVLNCPDLIREAEVWRSLKRSLQNGRLEVHALESLSPLGVTGVRPEPVPLHVKVVLLGSNDLYETLQDNDDDFGRIFKVKAEFDESLKLTEEHAAALARAAREIRRRESLLPFAKSGLQALVERAAREAGRRNRLSSSLASLADCAREASYHARRAGRTRIDRTAVDAAERRFVRQHSLENEIHNRMVFEGVYLIATNGKRIGMVNGLTVVSLGPLEFGRVARVSATVSAGEENWLSVEREIELSGPIHTKGVLLLESFIRNRFGQKRSIPAKINLTFDQNYGPIDGDSASSTEVYALLSALARLPVRQDVAVTGAVSMDGELLAVGGANEKIEGFFEICRARGLNGTQGVLIPASNLEDLMLDGEVVEAVRRGEFHLWTARNVDQAIHLLTDVPAGEPQADGSWPADSVMGRVDARLAEFEKALKSDDKDKDAAEDHPGPQERRQAARGPRRRKR
ncbi:MAG TPA: AAA family ATPase [Planctomycetota bacterium]